MSQERLKEPIDLALKPGIMNDRSQYGASLLEALIAMVVVSVGLLGIAGLQMKALQSVNQSADISKQNVLASDFAERLWAVSGILAGAEKSNLVEIATRTRDQWIEAHEGKVVVDEEENCAIPDCCPDPICFIDPESISSGNLVFVEPGAQHPEYTFRIGSSNTFSVVLPAVALLPEFPQ